MKIEEAISFEALYESMEKCTKGVLWKSSVQSYYLNGIEQTLKLEGELKSGTYEARKPKHFTIHHPKERDIVSIPFRDRVYQRSLNDNILYPEITKHFIYDNMACQKGKGTDKARNRLKCFLQREYRRRGNDFYVLQIDIKGYYPNMRHDVAKRVFKKYLDADTYSMAEKVLDGQYAGDVGFNPGSQMVQICGISVLNDLDHLIKERMRVRSYIRYMDDLVLMHESKDVLEECLEEIKARLAGIGLEVNQKKTSVYPVRNGIQFLGFRFCLAETGKVYMQLDPKNVKNERKHLQRMVSLTAKGKLTKEKVDACYEGWKAHAGKGNSYKLLQRMDKYYKDLWREQNELQEERRSCKR